MPIIDLEAPDVSAKTDTPKGFSVMPGALDIDHGSKAPTEKPAWSSTFAAAFRQDNVVTSFFASDAMRAPDFKEDGFNPWETIKGSPYEQHWSRFVEVRNTAHADAIKRDIDQETADRKLLDAAPWYQWLPASLMAGVADPTMLMPGGAFVRGAKGGFSIAGTAASVGRAAAVSATAQEAMLHSSQQIRTVQESAVAVGASAVLGGLLGAGGAKLLSGLEWSRGVQRLDAEAAGSPVPEGPISDLIPERAANTNSMAASVGAAARPRADIEDLTIAGKAAGALAKATEQLNPALRLLQSPSAETRQIATQTFENAVYLKQNMEGLASGQAAETLMKEWNAPLAQAITRTEEAFQEARKAGWQGSRKEFRDEVGRAMRRDDESPVPQIAAAAKEWRERIFEPLKVAAIEARLLPPDVTTETAASYFSRMWNVNRLVRREQEFKGIVRSWVEAETPKWAQDFDRAADRKTAALYREIDDLEMRKLRRGEELRRREEGDETAADEFTEADIRSALRIVQGGAPKPKGVDTLTQFVQKAGGLVDSGGELAARGITNKVRPGFVRSEARSVLRLAGKDGGWRLDDMTRHAWESGYFPDHIERPGIDDFLNALEDDFFKRRVVVRHADQDAFRLNDLVERLDQDLNRLGVDRSSPRFSTSEEVKGIVARVHQALDAEADQRIGALRSRAKEIETENRIERESRFGDEQMIRAAADEIADQVFDRLTGRTVDGDLRPEFIKVAARGPLKERTFNIPDHLVEDFLEHDVDLVGRRYTRIMGADVELTRKFGSVTMDDQIRAIRDNYNELRAGVTDEKELARLADSEKDDIRDLTAVRDLLRGTYQQGTEGSDWAALTRSANAFNYIRSMGENVLSSLTDVPRIAMVHGLTPFLGGVEQLATNMKGVRMSVGEAQLAGNVLDRVLAHQLATLAEVADPYTARGPIEKFLANMSNVASTWNGARLWQDGMKSFASVLTQNRILDGVTRYAAVKDKERAYLAFLGVDEGMASRIAGQFLAHGDTIDRVRVANTEAWTDREAVRAYRAAVNKDVDSVVITRSVADVPLFAHTPTGRMVLQFKSFALASHQRVLLRGMQEDQARFVGGLVAMTATGMAITWLKAVSGNRTEKLEDIGKNPGWWIAEGLDRSGVFSIPMEVANTFEKMVGGVNPIKGPITAFDEGSAISQKNQHRNKLGAIAGPTVGLLDDVTTVAGVPVTAAQGEDPKKSQWNAAERLIPFNSYVGMRQMLKYVLNPPDAR